MTTLGFRSSKAHTGWHPRPPLDPTLRRQVYGRVRPMDEDRGLLARLFGR